MTIPMNEQPTTRCMTKEDVEAALKKVFAEVAPVIRSLWANAKED